MSESTCPRRFFLGANSPQGFVSRFDQLDFHDPNWHTFIIKGGPGCGKSSLMRRLAKEFEGRTPSMELISCSSDSHSLDAVILPEWKASIVDGTAPHVLEAVYPAVNQSILSLGDFLDPIALKSQGEVVRQLSQTISKNCVQAYDYLAAARTFLSDSYRIALSCVDVPKLSAYAARFATKVLPRLEKSPDSPAMEQSRFLSSISCDGLTLYHETAFALCKKVYFIQDDFGAVSSLFLNAIRSRALELGHNVIVCTCCLYPHSKIDHLLIPDAGIAFLSENHFHQISTLEPYRRIHARRFEDEGKLKLRKRRLAFNQKAAGQFLSQAVDVLKETKAVHDSLEEIYQAAMDFSHIDKIFDRVAEDIVRFHPNLVS